MFGDLRGVLRERGFRLLYATRLSAQAADGGFQIALAGFLLFSPERQTTAAAAAAAFATVLLPYSLVGPFAGVFIDRVRRQRILVTGNLLRVLLVVGLASVVAAGESGWPFYVVALTLLSVNRFFLSALSASLPHVVAPRRLVVANSFSTTSGTLAALLGAGIGAGVRALVGDDDAGTSYVVLVAGLGYLVSAVVAARIEPDLLGPDPDPERPETTEALRRVASGLAAGARHVWHRRAAGNALAAIGAHRFFYGLSTVATFLLYRNYFGTDLTGFGQAVVASGVGFFAAALATPVIVRRIGTTRWIVVAFAIAAVAEVTLVPPFTEQLFLVAALVLGFVAQASKICVDTIVQTSVADAYRGRVFSFYDVLFNVAFVAAAVAGALTLPASGKSYAMVFFVGAGYAATALLYALAQRPSRPSSSPADGVGVGVGSSSETSSTISSSAPGD